MIDSFLKSLELTQLDQKADRLLIAISGGVDSVVLAHLLIESGFQVVLAHMNFGLRGSESDKDEDFVVSLAQKWKVEIEVKIVDTKQIKTELGISTQMLARDLRYDWFKELVKKYDAKLVTAHHQGDATETFLLNLIRGTGIKGLTGMHFENNGVFRPLLNYTKADLIDYAKSIGLLWREDQSNASNDYKRNSLRNEVIPLLKKQNPNFDETLNRVASRLKNVDELLIEATKQFKSSWKKVGSVTVIPIAERINPEVLYYSLTEFGFNYDAILTLLGVIDNKSVGKKIATDTHELFLDRAELKLVPIEKNKLIDQVLNLGKTDLSYGSVTINQVHGVDLSSSSKSIQFFDESILKTELRIRNWEEGDVFRPLGMKGKQKISDFLVNNKVSLHDKKKVLVLLSNNKIAWVVGYRISEDVKVSSFKEAAVKITCQF